MTSLLSRLDEIEAREWRCFHCDEVFTTRDDAAAHFGDSELEEPACKLNAMEGGILGLYREAQQELARHRGEESDSYREIYSLGADHAVALRREEEKGYAKGLADAAALATKGDAEAPTDYAVIGSIVSAATAGGVSPAVAINRLAAAQAQFTQYVLGDPRKGFSISDTFTAPEGTGKIIRDGDDDERDMLQQLEDRDRE